MLPVFFRSLLLIFVAIGCSAQSPAPSSLLNRRIENRLRSQFSIPPNIKITVGEQKPGEFPGYDDLPVTLEGHDHKTALLFLISKDGKTLAHLEKMDLSSDLVSKIDLTGRPVRGNKDAKVTIINYDDFQCPFCAHMHQTLSKDVLDLYGDTVKIIYKDYPLFQAHPWALHAAVDANCLGQQSSAAYWAFADYVHSNQRDINGEKRSLAEQTVDLDRITTDQAKKAGIDGPGLQACVKAQDQTAVKASAKEGDAVGVDSTPTLFVNGEKISGALPTEVMATVINRALRSVGVPVPAKALAVEMGAPIGSLADSPPPPATKK